MDIWKFFDITHKEHVVCNPMSVEKIDELIGLLRLQPGAHVIEIACGKGEFLVRLAEHYGVAGIGVDISPYCIHDAKQKARERVPDAQLEFIEMDGAEFQPDEAESCDLAVCLGASWIFDGYRGTLEALMEMTVPGGLVIVGEPFWMREPDQAYLAAVDWQPDTYSTHHGNAEIGEGLGLTLLYSIVSGHDDWDRYEGLQWYASHEYARTHPDDPDVPELLADVERSKEIYLKWARDTLGWAIYVFRKLRIEN
ncbi:MAG: putative protein YjhP [Anaerolineales bacterium]|nr:putative protein YjhP [Anaerolineales bacterium]